MKVIKLSWRAVFRQPIGILNPAGYTMGGTFPVEIFGQGDKWQAREIASPKRAVYTKLPKFASVANGKATVANVFRERVEDWYMWGTVAGDGVAALSVDRVLLPSEVKDLGEGKYGWYTAEDFTHILHHAELKPGFKMPPAACGVQVPVNCFVNNKLSVPPSCTGCLEVWEREYQNA